MTVNEKLFVILSGFTLSSHSSLALLATNLKDFGIDVVSTANNHCMDTNYSGLVSTLKYLDEAEIAHTGTNVTKENQNKILIKDVNGIKIAFLAFTYGTNGIPIPTDKSFAVNLINEELIIEQIKLAKGPKKIIRKFCIKLLSCLFLSLIEISNREILIFSGA